MKYYDDLIKNVDQSSVCEYCGLTDAEIKAYLSLFFRRRDKGDLKNKLPFLTHPFYLCVDYTNMNALLCCTTTFQIKPFLVRVNVAVIAF